MSEQEVISRLGEPQRRDDNHYAYWRELFGDDDVVELKVRFHREGVARHTSISWRSIKSYS